MINNIKFDGGRFISRGRYQLVFIPDEDIAGDYVARWRFDDGEGTTAAEDVLNLDGTLVGTPTWVSGNIGSNAIDFDGTDDVVTVPNNDVLDISSGGFAVSVWFNHDTNTGHFGIIHNHSGSPPSDGWEIDLNNGNPRFFSDGNNLELERGSSLTINQWYHLVINYDEVNYKMYIDGSEVDTALASVGSPEFGSAGISIGARFGDRAFFNGTIDDVRIYNRALTTDEISGLHDEGAA